MPARRACRPTAARPGARPPAPRAAAGAAPRAFAALSWPMLWPILRLVLLALLLAAAGPLRAADDDDADARLDAARQQVERIEKRLADDTVPDAELADIRQRLLALQQQAEAIADDNAPALASAQARLTELGAAPADGSEAADVADQRRGLQKTIDTLDARVKLARLLTVQSEQLADRAGGLRRERFRAELFERTESILSPDFWGDLRANLPRDGARLAGLGRTLAAAASQTAPQHWLGLAALVAGALLLRRWLGARIDAVTQRAPSGRVRRSIHAVAGALLAVLVPGTLAYALMRGLAGPLPADSAARGLLVDMVGAACFAGFVAGLGRALLEARRPSWRLLPLPDSVARGLRWRPAVIALVIFVGWWSQRLGAVVQTGLATEVAINGAYALVLGLVLAGTVGRAERLRRAARVAAGEPAAERRPGWMTLALFAARALLVAALVGIVVGYVALGAFVVRQVAWIGVLAMTAYLVDALIDDTTSAWLAAREAAPAADDGGVPPGRRLARQAAVLFAGALRVTVVLVVLVLVLAPYGEGPTDLLQRTGQLQAGITVGELQLRPTAVLQALLVFVLAVAAMRALRRWLDDRFLPTTSLDAGMRSSVSTLVGFVGTVVAIGLGLSAVGLALDKVAWIASALTVGIGFGLQAIVSNFVSGLILLAERPVKVGDWVALGGVEGDIRRINVRATEIQMGDRSTVIVPNSEFITKVVRNVTHQNPLGLVQIKLPMPLDTDTRRAREILLAAFTEHPDVLDAPAPNVQLDGIDAAGSVVFNATGFVASPRQSYGVKSALLFTVLEALPKAGLPLWKPPSTMLLREPQAPLPPAEPPAPL